MGRVILAAGVLAVASAAPARAEFILGLTNNNSLIGFDSATPGTASSQVFITGTQGNIVAIDRRPLNGVVYGLTAGGLLYTINESTGAATLQSTLSVAAQIASAIVGGFDFNPSIAATANNALRIITSADGNYRVGGANLTNGTTATDTPITPATLDIVGSAYTNNFTSAPTTQLYGLDAVNNTLLLAQGNPNDGVYLPVGAGLGVDIDQFTGFDISGLTGTAYASLDTPAPGTGFYTINLTTGTASLVGTTGLTLVDIAAPVGLTVPAVPVPATLPLVLLTAAGVAAVRRRRIG